MAGLNLSVGGFGGVASAPQSMYGSQESYDTVTSAAFGPGSTVVAPGHPMTSMHGMSIATWVGLAAVAALVALRYSLPN